MSTCSQYFRSVYIEVLSTFISIKLLLIEIVRMQSIQCWLVSVAIFSLQHFSFTMQTSVENVITVKSIYSVRDTVDLIETDIKAQGGMIFCRIDQKKEAEQVGLVGELDDTEVIIFGNPAVGTPLMVENGFVSIELPL